MRVDRLRITSARIATSPSASRARGPCAIARNATGPWFNPPVMLSSASTAPGASWVGTPEQSACSATRKARSAANGSLGCCRLPLSLDTWRVWIGYGPAGGRRTSAGGRGGGGGGRGGEGFRRGAPRPAGGGGGGGG